MPIGQHYFRKKLPGLNREHSHRRALKYRRRRLPNRRHHHRRRRIWPQFALELRQRIEKFRTQRQSTIFRRQLLAHPPQFLIGLIER